MAYNCGIADRRRRVPPAPMTADPTRSEAASLFAALPSALRTLVVKDHVHLGGLPQPLRLQALALVWCCLPRTPRDERGINDALRDALAGGAAFLSTDHVELRRWLVDTGLLARDGFGRVYERVAFEGLPAPAQAAVAGLREVDADALAAACRAARSALAEQRAARRAAWEGRAAVTAAPTAGR
jgi:hypothetical protein